ncbi:MAG: hypothetical protein JO270_12445 [Acidobacteriaceae bacterium]|nr:hypothetical protein [Acidobacteriaceae bacterium]MBV8572125.1 hypothetical protein [Acidobacteriaceae bacterium]
MKNSVNSLVMAAAISGLLGGTAARLQAAPQSATSNSGIRATSRTAADSARAGKTAFARTAFDDQGSKHSCKGKNDCKGQGGCKAGDNGCKGKNSCKGKGGCATDGSKPPQVA